MTNLTSQILDELSDLPTGVHLCHFYKTPQDMLDVLVPYFAAGLEKNCKCLWILDSAMSKAQASEAMANAVPDWQRHLEDGNLVFMHYTDWYVPEGDFDAQRTLRKFAEMEAVAMSEGYSSMRVSGNTLWARDGMWEDLLAYEQHVGECFLGSNLSAICTYPVDRCSAADIIDVAHAHDRVLIRRDGAWQILESATVRHMQEELRESHERLKALTQQIVDIEQRERKRVSQALHDGLQQTLVGIQLNLARAFGKSGEQRDKVLSGIPELLDEALQACRTLTTEISPPILHERGLLPALKWIAAWFEKQHGLSVHLSLPDTEPPLADSARVTLFEIARELLFNVAKHAEVCDARISLREGFDNVLLTVEDEGKGCETDVLELELGEAHFGLFTIRERLVMMGGRFSFESTPGAGTQVTIQLPKSESQRTFRRAAQTAHA